MSIAPFHIPKILRIDWRRSEPGSVPGTIMQQPDQPKPEIRCIRFDAETLKSEPMPYERIEDALQPHPGKVTWVDVQGLGDADLLRRIGAELGLHPLIVEDIAHTHQRPKLEEFDTLLFGALRAVRVDEHGNIDNEQLSFVLKPGLLVTFQEHVGDGFAPVRRRLSEGKGSIRSRGADYLLYALVDTTIDNYFPVLEIYGDTMEDLDEKIRLNPRPNLSHAVHALRRELRQLRRAVWPLRDVASALGRGDLDQIGDTLKPSFRDCYDHVMQVADFVEGSRERASDLGDLYQVMVSERTNQVMKVLTIIATVFIPLTFLCGLYGMNFDPASSPYNMPELRWRYGYPALLSLMGVTVAAMVWFFYRRGWIDTGSST